MSLIIVTTIWRHHHSGRNCSCLTEVPFIYCVKLKLYLTMQKKKFSYSKYEKYSPIPNKKLTLPHLTKIVIYHKKCNFPYQTRNLLCHKIQKLYSSIPNQVHSPYQTRSVLSHTKQEASSATPYKNCTLPYQKSLFYHTKQKLLTLPYQT